jgi:hypothetical protein
MRCVGGAAGGEGVAAGVGLGLEIGDAVGLGDGDWADGGDPPQATTAITAITPTIRRGLIKDEPDRGLERTELLAGRSQ